MDIFRPIAESVPTGDYTLVKVVETTQGTYTNFSFELKDSKGKKWAIPAGFCGRPWRIENANGTISVWRPNTAFVARFSCPAEAANQFLGKGKPCHIEAKEYPSICGKGDKRFAGTLYTVTLK